MRRSFKRKSLFETNDLSNMNIIEFDDGDKVSNLYWMDNFYKNPDDVFEWMNSIEPPLWKYGDEWDHSYGEHKSLNTLYFEDRRHLTKHSEVRKLYKNLEIFTPGQETLDDDEFISNYTRFSRVKENPYETHYWWPHHDSGYNGICYFSKNEEIGTHIYKPLVLDRPDILALDENGGDRCEHGIPWTPKDLWEIVISFKSKYNRFVMFEGRYYYHSMNLTGKNYFADHYSNADYRINQVFFFGRENCDIED